MEKLIQLYKNWSGAEPKSVEKIPGAGSNREYYRFYDAEGKSVIGVVGIKHNVPCLKVTIKK